MTHAVITNPTWHDPVDPSHAALNWYRMVGAHAGSSETVPLLGRVTTTTSKFINGVKPHHNSCSYKTRVTHIISSLDMVPRRTGCHTKYGQWVLDPWVGCSPPKSLNWDHRLRSGGKFGPHHMTSPWLQPIRTAHVDMLPRPGLSTI